MTQGVFCVALNIGIIVSIVFFNENLRRTAINLSAKMEVTSAFVWWGEWAIKLLETDRCVSEQIKNKCLDASCTCFFTSSWSSPILSALAIQPDAERSTNVMFSWRKQAALYFRLLAPASTTFCSQYSDVFLLLCAWSALAGKFSGLAHALKLVNIEASSKLNNSLQVSCDSPRRQPDMN